VRRSEISRRRFTGGHKSWFRGHAESKPDVRPKAGFSTVLAGAASLVDERSRWERKKIEMLFAHLKRS
jgi:hypothetical protein